MLASSFCFSIAAALCLLVGQGHGLPTSTSADNQCIYRYPVEGFYTYQVDLPFFEMSQCDPSFADLLESCGPVSKFVCLRQSIVMESMGFNLRNDNPGCVQQIISEFSPSNLTVPCVANF